MANEFFNSTIWKSRDDLIATLYNSRRLNEAIQNIVSSGKATRSELRKELKSELFLRLCELDESELKQIHSDGYLDYYILRTLKNMFSSDRSTFYNKIRKGIANRKEEENDLLHIADELDHSPTESEVESAIKSLTWFESQVLFLYSEHKSIEKVREVTGVTVRYSNKILASAKKKMRHALSNH